VEPVDLFEVIGPVMVGPSSSHTAGAIRLGLLARAAAGFVPVQAVIDLHGSFAETGRGHGTDRGLVAGLLGWAPDDHRLAEVGEHARAAGMAVEFRKADLGRVHPNTARFNLTGPTGQAAVIQGSSVGGGAVQLTELDGWTVELAGLYHTLLIGHTDRPGVLARITNSLAAYGLNIATMRVSRHSRGGDALTTVELDNEVAPGAIALLQVQADILWVRAIGKI
jgi:L-serine dehydratase